MPTGYDVDRLVLMVRDPWWIFAYWDLRQDTERAARGQLRPEEVPGLRTVLRVHDVTDRDFPGEPSWQWMDIPLSGLANNWYIHTNAPNRTFQVDIGLLTAGGRFLLLARSNRVTTPRAGPSAVIDEEWVASDEAFEALFGATLGALRVGSSPGAWLGQALTGGWSSLALARGSGRAVKGLWFRLDTDLIVYGATDPKAVVTIQDQPVPVRKDGTFDVRLALPEGTQTITVTVTTPDGRQTRALAPVVTLRRAERPERPPTSPPATPSPESSQGIVG